MKKLRNDIIDVAAMKDWPDVQLIMLCESCKTIITKMNYRQWEVSECDACGCTIHNPIYEVSGEEE